MLFGIRSNDEKKIRVRFKWQNDAVQVHDNILRRERPSKEIKKLNTVIQ